MKFPTLVSTSRTLLLALGLGLVCGPARARELDLLCGWAAAPAPFVVPGSPDSPSYRKYAPSRAIDILHLTLDVTPDFRQRTVAGSATWKFKPIAQPLAELQLDAVDLTVSSVTATEKILGYQVTEDKVIVTFAESVPVGKEASVTVRYSAQPEKGLYFRTPELGFKAEDMHLWTQGEAEEARHWYPSYDYPNEKFTTEMICHAPADLVVLSNGRKISSEKDADGLVAVRWLQDKPMVNYLVALVVGRLKSIEDQHGNIPLHFWTPATEIEHAANSFEDTKKAMIFFEQEIGVPYPWDKYDQVCIQDYHWGGMENTTLTTLNINTLFPKNFENLRSSQGLVAHELAHQWFGDLLTCKDWSHIWLNEGFATFYDDLYTEHKDGRQEFLYRMHESSKGLLAPTAINKSIVWRKYSDASEQFDAFAYGKGSWVLNMLRSQLGPELYRQCIKTYVERHKFGSVVTEDLRAVIEELSGRSFDQFFDQWVYHTGTPRVEADYSWDERTKTAKLSIRQTHAVTENVPLFNFPLPVRFQTKSGLVDRIMQIKDRAEDFAFPLDAAPVGVRLDPEVGVLATINFRPPAPMLAAQLTDKSDTVGRLLAVDQLAERRDHDAIIKLKNTLNNDPHYGVRQAASRALRAMYTDETFDALVASMKQSDARVRKQVVADVTAFYRPAAFEQARAVLKAEKNPDIISIALSSLAPTGTNARATLLEYLNGDSWRQHLTETALVAMRSQNDPFYVEPVREMLQKRGKALPSRTVAIGLDTLASLSRDLVNKEEVRTFIAGHVNDLRQNVKLAAINALGTLRDERALPVLERLATAQKTSPERTAAERAIESIRTGRKTQLEAGDVRREVIDLQKQNRDLRKDLDALKKKVDAASAPAPKKK